MRVSTRLGYLPSLLLGAAVLVMACQPAAPASPTAAPKADKPAAGGSPEAKPAASPGATGASPAASPGAAASPAASPGAAPKPSAGGAPASTSRVDPSLAATWEGKTVTLVVGANPGGGYDTWSRTLARFMPKYLPGNPQMIVQNMDGANHKVATNFIYAARPDGLTIGMVDRYIPHYQLIGEGATEGVRYDVTKINWLGSASIGTQVLAVRNKDGVSTSNLTPLTQGEWRIAQQDPGSSPHVFASLSRELLGWKVDSIFGFPGNPEIALSLQRSETDGMITDSDTQERLLMAEFASGAMVPVVQYGDAKDRPHLRNTPTMAKLLEGKGPEAQRLFDIGRLPFQWSRPLLAPPGMPDNMVSTLRAALLMTLEDSEFLQEAQRLRLEIQPVPGETVQQLITTHMSTPKTTVQTLLDYMDKDM